MKYLLLILLFGISSCSGTSIQYSTFLECEDKPEVREKLAEFIIDCSQVPNPKVDEDDLVSQCEKTGRNIYCLHVIKCRINYDNWLYTEYGKWQDKCE